ncbi:hypothetical protein IVB41_12455 [Bradyrhizobium sp. 44]|uniref:hypothetical protein n=1 Tax=Bradyrhizobium sp. 44 TaxID=2782675 RepID=UPI001FF9792A|nr:hypothetical protein [Bradyrhizobium sp. 44]MCK1284727.1 hypothetical protein [Bradyrhizobium sp. 44]
MRWNLVVLVTAVLSSTAAFSAEAINVQFLEVTQSVQDDRNSIGLIAGKRTFVRAFVEYHGASAASKVRGTIELKRAAGGVRTIDSLPSVETTLEPSENGKLDMKRKKLDRGLVFEIPQDWTGVGELAISLTGASFHNGTRLACSDCDKKGVAVSFKQGAGVRVVLLGMSYKRSGKTFAPRAVDYKSALSWLRRAYPSSDFEFETRVIDWSAAPQSFDKGLKSCNMANAAIAAIRKLDLASGKNALFHYYGLVYYDGTSEANFMRGCSSLPPSPDPSAVGSGPAGVGYDWDSSPSFAGWYAGHELGHTFGRHHPVSGCGDLDETGGDAAWPNKIPKNRLGTADEPFVAFDAGDSDLPTPMTVWGWDKAADVMTYCSYVWPSAHNYVEMCNRISAENGAQCPLSSPLMAAAGPAGLPNIAAGPGGAPLLVKNSSGLLMPVADRLGETAGAGSAMSGPVVSLTGRIDLDSGSGEISAVNRLDRSVEKAPSDKSAETPTIRSYDAQGRVLSDVPATVLLDSDRAAGDPRTGVVSGEVPYSNDIARLELLYKDKAIAVREAAPTRPAISQPTADLPRLNELLKGLNSLTAGPRQIGEFSKANGALTYTWHNQGSASVRYTVQISTNGGKDWNTVAVESPQRSITIDPTWIEGASTLDVRVRASDGIHETVSTSRPLDLGARLPLQ